MNRCCAALKEHEKRATMVLELEDKVAAAVKKLKERGLVSPYLRSFVVARINPLRWITGEPPPLEEVLKTMRERATKFNVEKIKPQDLASRCRRTAGRRRLGPRHYNPGSILKASGSQALYGCCKGKVGVPENNLASDAAI